MRIHSAPYRAKAPTESKAGGLFPHDSVRAVDSGHRRGREAVRTRQRILPACSVPGAVFPVRPGQRPRRVVRMTTPAEPLRSFARTRASLDGEQVTYWWSGEVYSRAPDEPYQRVFGFEGLNVARLVQDAGAGPDAYRLLTREAACSLDPGTREILETWQDLPVVHVWNDPANQKWRPFPVPTTELGGQVCFSLEIPLACPRHCRWPTVPSTRPATRTRPWICSSSSPAAPIRPAPLLVSRPPCRGPGCPRDSRGWPGARRPAASPSTAGAASPARTTTYPSAPGPASPTTTRSSPGGASRTRPAGRTSASSTRPSSRRVQAGTGAAVQPRRARHRSVSGPSGIQRVSPGAWAAPGLVRGAWRRPVSCVRRGNRPCGGVRRTPRPRRSPGPHRSRGRAGTSRGTSPWRRGCRSRDRPTCRSAA